MFKAKMVKDRIVKWIRWWFAHNGKDCNAIIGISGGKDSSVVTALCVEALGKDRVIGVMMPNRIQDDIDKAYELVEHLGIRSIEVDIGNIYDAAIDTIVNGAYHSREDFPDFRISEQTKTNLPPRLRMSILYAISQSMNGRVSENCNASENFVGYFTRWGDGAGDFAPIANLTVSEVKAIGYELGLPTNLIEKTPSDGLCGKTDEDNLGFSYDALDRYVRAGVYDDRNVKIKIDGLHERNQFKMEQIPSYPLEADWYS